MVKLATLFDIVDKCMERLDVRLQKHLNRVAYLSLEYAKKNNLDEKTTKDLVLASYLHDIGIINTGKVDSLLELESETIIEHSVFGYIFLKYYARSFLPPVMLYHHVPYFKLTELSDYEKYLVNIVNLVDKVDFAVIDLILSKEKTNIVEYVEDYMSYIKADYSEEVFEGFKNILDEEILLNAAGDEFHDYVKEYIDTVCIKEEVYNSMLESVVFLIESHSVLTAGHSHITAAVAKKLAAKLDMNEEKQATLYYSGILHDIGKIAIPSNILKKPGKLNDEEYAEMKKHVEYSIDILEGNIPDKIYYPAIRHHENLSGTGYPNKVSNLSIEDEVLRMSDLLAALAESRYYRTSLPISIVKDIIEDDHSKNNSGEKVFNIVMENLEELYDFVIEEQATRSEQYQDIIETYVHLSKELSNLFLK